MPDSDRLAGRNGLGGGGERKVTDKQRASLAYFVPRRACGEAEMCPSGTLCFPSLCPVYALGKEETGT